MYSEAILEIKYSAFPPSHALTTSLMTTEEEAQSLQTMPPKRSRITDEEEETQIAEVQHFIL